MPSSVSPWQGKARLPLGKREDTISLVQPSHQRRPCKGGWDMLQVRCGTLLCGELQGGIGKW